MLGARLAFEYERVRNKTAFWGLGMEGGQLCTARLGVGHTLTGKAHKHMHTHRRVYTHIHAHPKT